MPALSHIFTASSRILSSMHKIKRLKAVELKIQYCGNGRKKSESTEINGSNYNFIFSYGGNSYLHLWEQGE